MSEDPEPVRDERVNPVWKWIAMVVTGILLGGSPAYVSLAMDARAAITRRDVDTEVTNLNAPIITSISDLKDQVKDLVGEVHELRAIQK